MLISLSCPNCGANMQIDETKDHIFCTHCGTKIVNMASKVEVTHNINIRNVVDRRNEPTLIISFASINPSVKMVTRIVETGQKDVYISGQTIKFRLAPGKHAIVLKIGKINYNREIYVPEDLSPVTITASWDGRAHINIDQPEYVVQAAPAANQNYAGNGPMRATGNTNTQPTPEDNSPAKQIFCKKMIAPWIISGVLVLFFLTFMSSNFAAAFFFLLAAAAMNPVTLYFISRKAKALKIAAYIAAGILGTIGIMFVGGSDSESGSSESSGVAKETVTENTTETTAETTVTEAETTTEATSEVTTEETTTEETTTEETTTEESTTEETTIEETTTVEETTEKQVSGVSYSTNDKDSVKNGNSGVYAYRNDGANYKIYYIIDFDEGYVYKFTDGNGDGTCDKVPITSGDLKSGLEYTYHDGASTWSEKIYFKSANKPDYAIMSDDDGSGHGNKLELNATNLENALKLRDKKTIHNY